MAKRIRGSRSSHRPGGQGPSRTKKAADDTTTPAADVSEASADVDIDAAVGAVGAEITEIAIEEPAPAAPRPRRARRGTKIKADSLVARATAEDVYVREDLRRIGIVSATLLAALLIAWVLLVAMDLLGLY